MTTKTEGRHMAGFVLWEASTLYSRENGTVKSGENLVAGEIVELDSTELVAWNGGTVEGILLDNVDASDAAVPAAYLARSAVVALDGLTFTDDSDSHEADAISGLEAIGIIAR